MLAWLAANAATIIILMVIIVLAGLAFRYMHKHGGTCGGDCGGCGGSCSGCQINKK